MNGNSVEQAYAYWAATFDLDLASGGLNVEEQVVISLVPPAVQDVLDAATGTGRYAVRLAQMGKRVTGVDASSEMLAMARANADRLGLAIDFRQAVLPRVPLDDESVDAVVCAMAVAHIPDLEGVMREFFRVLRPAGVLVVSDLHPIIQKHWGPGYTAFVKDGRFMFDVPPEQVEAALECFRVPFPQYRTEMGEYVDAIQAAHGEVLTVVEIRSWQNEGLLPFVMVVLGRKPKGGRTWRMDRSA